MVEEPHLRILDGCTSVYELATCALRTGSRLSDEAQKRLTAERLEYDLVYGGKSEWKLPPPGDNPEEPDDEMCHSLPNLEHHHFKFEGHRRGGDGHVHFFGTDCLSFGAGIKLEDGDSIQVSFAGFGRPLRNTVHVAKSEAVLIEVTSLG